MVVRTSVTSENIGVDGGQLPGVDAVSSMNMKSCKCVLRYYLFISVDHSIHNTPLILGSPLK